MPTAPDPNALPPFWRSLTDICCGNCSTPDDPYTGRRFKDVQRIKKFGVLHPDNPWKKDHYYRVFLQVCVDCGQELYYTGDATYLNCKERPSHTTL